VKVIMVEISEFTKVVRGEVRSVLVRRRRWSREAKGRIVAQAIAPGAMISEVARRHDLVPQQLSNWIRAAKAGLIALPAQAGMDFVPVLTEAVVGEVPAVSGSAIEIVIGAMVIRVPADTHTLETVLRVVKNI
jgi:transposase